MLYVTTIVITRVLNVSHRTKTFDVFQVENLKAVFDAKGVNEVRCFPARVNRAHRWLSTSLSNDKNC